MKKLNKNTLAYFYYKMVKQSGSPESIARGAAIGLFIGFAVPFGGQMITALPLAFLLRANKILALAFTWVTNHFTIIVIYPVQCYIGSVLIGSPLTFKYIDKMFETFFKERTWESFKNLGEGIMIPFLAGGLLIGAISALIGYFAVYGIVLRYRARRDMKLRKRLISAAKKHEMTDTKSRFSLPGFHKK